MEIILPLLEEITTFWETQPQSGTSLLWLGNLAGSHFTRSTQGYWLGSLYRGPHGSKKEASVTLIRTVEAEEFITLYFRQMRITLQKQNVSSWRASVHTGHLRKRRVWVHETNSSLSKRNAEQKARVLWLKSQTCHVKPVHKLPCVGWLCSVDIVWGCCHFRIHTKWLMRCSQLLWNE